MTNEPNRKFEAIAREATKCRECFILGQVTAPSIDIAQPLWVGERYWTSPFKVAILMCNPGQGLGYDEWTRICRDRLREFRDGVGALAPILEDQRGARWWRFYVEGLHLDPDETAFANVAWCATKDNTYPPTVLWRCFERHTCPLLELLRPKVVLAAGGEAQRFSSEISRLSCSPVVVSILHHAHRKGRAASVQEFDRVRRELKRARIEGAG